MGVGEDEDFVKDKDMNWTFKEFGFAGRKEKHPIRTRDSKWMEEGIKTKPAEKQTLTSELRTLPLKIRVRQRE